MLMWYFRNETNLRNTEVKQLEKAILEKLVNIEVKLNLKTNFGLTGHINAVFEYCIEFETEQTTSYIDFDQIATIKKLK